MDKRTKRKLTMIGLFGWPLFWYVLLFGWPMFGLPWFLMRMILEPVYKTGVMSCLRNQGEFDVIVMWWAIFVLVVLTFRHYERTVRRRRKRRF
jgi:uncharacterized membrane protein